MLRVWEVYDERLQLMLEVHCLISGVESRLFWMFWTFFRSGVSLARSVELTVQVDKILRIGPVYPVTLDDLQSVREMLGMLVGLLETSTVHRIVVYG